MKSSPYLLLCRPRETKTEMGDEREDVGESASEPERTRASVMQTRTEFGVRATQQITSSSGADCATCTNIEAEATHVCTSCPAAAQCRLKPTRHLLSVWLQQSVCVLRDHDQISCSIALALFAHQLPRPLVTHQSERRTMSHAARTAHRHFLHLAHGAAPQRFPGPRRRGGRTCFVCGGDRCFQ